MKECVDEHKRGSYGSYISLGMSFIPLHCRSRHVIVATWNNLGETWSLSGSLGLSGG